MTAPRPLRGRRPDELEHWRMLLTTGYDFFHVLNRIGLDADNLPRGAARAAWRMYGAQIMATWAPDPRDRRQKPWGLEQFGPPPP